MYGVGIYGGNLAWLGSPPAPRVDCGRCFADDGGPGSCTCETYCGSILCDKFRDQEWAPVDTASSTKRS
jgi:hypothetical protein